MSATRVRQPHEIRACDANRLVVRPRLEHDRLSSGEPLVDHHRVASLPADGRHGAELELAVVALERVLGREVHLLRARSEEAAELADVAARQRDDDRLRHVGGIEAERLRLRERGLRMTVRQELERDALRLEHGRQILAGHGSS